ncbi:MAG: hypothetical protein EPN21_12380 [Methylococcaceae bacterium]|nr:MAG: hypothetical protein EPN21_12380 [Methylococcaceae bacterium]
MFKIKLSVLMLCLLALTTAQTSHAAAKVCTKTGFFNQFLLEQLKLTGNCDDPDLKVGLRMAPSGLQLTGLGINPPIPITILSDTQATASGIQQFGLGGHSARFDVINGSSFSLHLENEVGGNCDVIAKGGSRCIYEVVRSNCPSSLLPGDKVCAACTNPSPCPDYGSNLIPVWVQGTPVISCSVELSPVSSNCANCTGKSIAPK